jgi:hypothetical protein
MFLSSLVRSQIAAAMLFGKVIRADSLGMNVKQVRRLAKLRLALGDHCPCEDHARSAFRQVSGEALPEGFPAPKAGS